MLLPCYLYTLKKYQKQIMIAAKGYAAQSPEANLAPWNFAERRLQWQNGSVRIDDKYDLLFFHFYGVKRTGRYYFNSHRVFSAPFPRLMREHVYKTYIAILSEAEGKAAQLLDHEKSEAGRKLAVNSRADRFFNVLRRTRTMAFRGVDVITGRANAVPDHSSRSR